jgi:hypothetical protein
VYDTALDKRIANVYLGYGSERKGAKQMRKLSRYETKVVTSEYGGFVRYHQTEIVSWNATHIVLNSDGWRTVTTKRKMNQTSDEFDLGFSVYQHKHQWFVTFNGTTIPFEDRMLLVRKQERIAA